MNIAESHEILESYQRVASQPVISVIERLLKVNAIQTGVGSLASGLPAPLSLMGLGKDIWKGIEAQDYINKIRDEWKD